MTTLPAHLQNIPNRNLAATAAANIGAGTPPFVSIQGNRFTLVDAGGAETPVPTYDPKTGPYLDCVIVDVLERLSKIWFGHNFDPNANSYSPPECWSDNGVAPSRNASNPQSPTCAGCPHDVWGSEVSKVSGKGVKACRDQQKVAVLVPGYDMLFLLRIPPNSLKNFRTFSDRFKGQAFDMPHLITRISFQQGVLGTLEFNPIDWTPDSLAPLVMAAIAEKKTDTMIGRTDVPRSALADMAQTASGQGYNTVPPLQVTGQVQVPFAPAPIAAFPSTASETASTQTAAPAQAASPSEPQQRRRRGRPPAAEQSTQPTGSTPAPFRQSTPQSAGHPNEEGLAGNGQGAPFGIQPNPPAPNAEVAATLKSIFG